MIAIPWYLLSLGILVLLAGLFLAALGNSSTGSPPLLDPRMGDDEIVRQLNRKAGSPLPGIVILVGGVMILVSLVWRILLLLF